MVENTVQILFTSSYVYLPSLLKMSHFSILNWSRFIIHPASLVKALSMGWKTFYLFSNFCSLLSTYSQSSRQYTVILR